MKTEKHLEGLSHGEASHKTKNDKRKHGIHTTRIEHHSDGSHTMHHSGPDVEMSSAHPDLDSAMDAMQTNLSTAQPEGEESPAAPPAAAA